MLSRARAETVAGTNVFVQELKKVMLPYKRKQGGQASAEPKDSSFEDSRIVRFQKTIDSLETKNKVLIGCLAGVFLLNLLIHFML